MSLGCICAPVGRCDTEGSVACACRGECPWCACEGIRICDCPECNARCEALDESGLRCRARWVDTEATGLRVCEPCRAGRSAP